jgi:hypothetical protein
MQGGQFENASSEQGAARQTFPIGSQLVARASGGVGDCLLVLQLRVTIALSYFQAELDTSIRRIQSTALPHSTLLSTPPPAPR